MCSKVLSNCDVAGPFAIVECGVGLVTKEERTGDICMDICVMSQIMHRAPLLKVMSP